MVIIAFAKNTSKLFPRLFCRHFYHCALIVPAGGALMLYQFTRRGHVTKISLRPRDLRVLRAHGWRFIYVTKNVPYDIDVTQSWTCVDMTKRALGIHAPLIQTPYGLYKYIHRRL